MSDRTCQELQIIAAKVNVAPPVLNVKSPEASLNPTEKNVIAAIANWTPKDQAEYELSWSSVSQAGMELWTPDSVFCSKWKKKIFEHYCFEK